MAKDQTKKLLQEGGLNEEGGTVDPVSGNDVPVGSTKKEVRDDIPAQLSEGEFVFPADVVRFIGLNNLMKLRQEAKEGLMEMDRMGQMGNSEEAVKDDTGEFDNDLDSIIEEIEREMAEETTAEDNEDRKKFNEGGLNQDTVIPTSIPTPNEGRLNQDTAIPTSIPTPNVKTEELDGYTFTLPEQVLIGTKKVDIPEDKRKFNISEKDVATIGNILSFIPLPQAKMAKGLMSILPKIKNKQDPILRKDYLESVTKENLQGVMDEVLDLPYIQSKLEKALPGLYKRKKRGSKLKLDLFTNQLYESGKREPLGLRGKGAQDFFQLQKVDDKFKKNNPTRRLYNRDPKEPPITRDEEMRRFDNELAAKEFLRNLKKFKQ